MVAVAMEDKKKEMIEKTAQEFQKLNGDNQRRWQEWKCKEHSMPSASLTLWQ